MEYRGLVYTVVQLREGGWRWEINLGDRLKSGETQGSRDFAIKIAQAEIDHFLKNRKKGILLKPVFNHRSL